MHETQYPPTFVGSPLGKFFDIPLHWIRVHLANDGETSHERHLRES